MDKEELLNQTLEQLELMSMMLNSIMKTILHIEDQKKTIENNVWLYKNMKT